MKRVNNIYYEELTLKNLYATYDKVYKSIGNKKELYEFHLNKNINLYNIFIKLYNKNWEFGKYKIFMISKPKRRLIMSEHIEDKIVNHFVAKYYLSKYLDKSLIHANVATREGRGGSLAYSLFEKYINKDSYVLKLDISKYFYNIDHNKAVELVEKKIKDRDVLNLIKKILNETNKPYVNDEIRKIKNREVSKFRNNKKIVDEINKIPNYINNKGVSIGNMTSQILAIFYLSEIDHYIKQELGFKKYIRYMLCKYVYYAKLKTKSSILSRISYI